MPIGKRTTDAWFSANGDLRLDSEKGDLKIATNEDRRVLRQTVLKILQSTYGDWSMHQDLGAGLSTFGGMPNTRETATLIESQIHSALTREGVLSSNMIRLQVLPVSNTELLVLLTVSVLFSRDAPITIQFSYDLRDNKFLPRIV